MATMTSEEIRVGDLAIHFLVEGEESGGAVAVAPASRRGASVGRSRKPEWNSWENLTGACHRCNAQKGPRPVLHFLLWLHERCKRTQNRPTAARRPA
jgi:hypothetical protein